MALMTSGLPVLAADLTYVKVNGGVAYSGLVDWFEVDPPIVGQHVMLDDGSNDPVEGVITDIRSDGALVLSVPAYVPASPSAR